jgi:SAM-dependent methyltransferase
MSASSSPIAFVGSIPELYDRHLGPVLFEPYAIDLARRLPHDVGRVLEVAAGTGRVTRHLLARLSTSGELVATDLNAPMLARAAELLTDPRVTWRTADALALPFGDAEFDAVACQFGLMFMPEPVRATREMRRVTRRGGRLLLSTWDDIARNGATVVLQDLIARRFGNDARPFMCTPFSMPDPNALAAIVTAGGWRQVTVDTVVRAGEARSAADLATGFVRGNPLWNQLVERALDVDRFERELALALAEQFGNAPCRSPLSAHVVTAIA